MKNFLPSKNPLYDKYQFILVNLINLLPHNGYLEEYITCNFFPWKEDFLNQHLNVYKKILLEEDNINFSRTISLNIEWIEKSLKEIKPRTVKISILNRQMPTYFSKLSEADFGIETNTLFLSADEEIMLNSGYFEDEINKYFVTLKNKIEYFYNTNKEKNRAVLHECLKYLSVFSVDKKYLEMAYNNQPKLKYKELDIFHFKDLISNQWKELMELVNDKKSLLNISNQPPNLSKEEESQIILANNVEKLTINQTVLLLNEIGFFSHPIIERASKVKQATLIRQITGDNAKNIKKKIELLNGNPKTYGDYYENDQLKIANIINSLI